VRCAIHIESRAKSVAIAEIDHLPSVAEGKLLPARQSCRLTMRGFESFGFAIDNRAAFEHDDFFSSRAESLERQKREKKK